MEKHSDIHSIQFDTHLPIHQWCDEIVQSIRENPVTIVAGDTGSGKSTQLPLLCLQAGRGRTGRIGCTQPRRIAATSLARFVGTRIDRDAVGFKVRFHDQAGPNTTLKFLTDGMLLAEISGDPGLNQYDTIIIDEAHERTINIDFLLGYFRTLLPRRPEFRLVITSATIDTRLFSRSFHRAPIITVSGRLYPIEIHYRPALELWQGERIDGYTEAVVSAVQSIVDTKEDGDILVFLPTVDDIDEVCGRLRAIAGEESLAVYPLHSRLPLDRQDRIFAATGSRKVVVSTNIAETSLTVPNIRFVIDSGLARRLRFDPSAGISRMPVDRISKASAGQRAGRCGRVRNGLCIRLYSEQDFDTRPEYTIAELRRANLAGVLLRMADLGLGRPETFPFIQRPSHAALSAGYRKLKELGAMSNKGRLTSIGRRMARFPLDPPIARMLLAAQEFGAVHEIAVIAAALSAQDPRENAAESSWQSRKTVEPRYQSDFMTFLALWKDAEAWNAFASRGALRKYSRKNGLSVVRMREWHDTYLQIAKVCRRLHLWPKQKRPASVDAIHLSLLSGLIGNIAHRVSKGEYAGIGKQRIHIHPSSVLFHRGPRWVLFHEIVETKKVYGRTAARIDPRWIETLFRPLCRYTWDSPVYDAERGIVTACEQVTLHGLPLITNRRVDLGTKDPETAHRVFVREALMHGLLGERHEFLEYNRDIRACIDRARCKLRDSTLPDDTELLYRWYSERVPEVTNRNGLIDSIRKAGSDEFLRVSKADISFLADARLTHFPDAVPIAGAVADVTYRFAPDTDDDGIEIEVTGEIADSVPRHYWEWAFPVLYRPRVEWFVNRLQGELYANGIGRDRAIDLILRNLEHGYLPKEDNRQSAPGESFPLGTGGFFAALTRVAFEQCGLEDVAVRVGAEEFPEWMWVRVSILPASNGVKKTYRPPIDPLPPSIGGLSKRANRMALFCTWEKADFHSWDGLTIPGPRAVGSPEQSPACVGIPALCIENDSVALRTFWTTHAAEREHRRATEWLIETMLAEELAWAEKEMGLSQEAIKLWDGKKTPEQLEQWFERFRHRFIIQSQESLPWTSEDFDRRHREAKQRIDSARDQGEELLLETGRRYHECSALLRKKSKKFRGDYFESILRELTGALEEYVGAFFDAGTSMGYIQRIPQFLDAFSCRIEAACLKPVEYRRKTRRIKAIEDDINGLLRNEKGGPSQSGQRFDELILALEEGMMVLFAPQSSSSRSLPLEQRIQTRIVELRSKQWYGTY